MSAVSFVAGFAAPGGTMAKDMPSSKTSALSDCGWRGELPAYATQALFGVR